MALPTLFGSWAFGLNLKFIILGPIDHVLWSFVLLKVSCPVITQYSITSIERNDRERTWALLTSQLVLKFKELLLPIYETLEVFGSMRIIHWVICCSWTILSSFWSLKLLVILINSIVDGIPRKVCNSLSVSRFREEILLSWELLYNVLKILRSHSVQKALVISKHVDRLVISCSTWSFCRGFSSSVCTMHEGHLLLGIPIVLSLNVWEPFLIMRGKSTPLTPWLWSRHFQLEFTILFLNVNTSLFIWINQILFNQCLPFLSVLIVN